MERKEKQKGKFPQCFYLKIMKEGMSSELGGIGRNLFLFFFGIEWSRGNS